MKEHEILSALFHLRDEDYAVFLAKLLPTVKADTVIGVRTPALRALAKELSGDPDVSLFLTGLPHPYFEENQLHAFVISLEKDFGRCVEQVESFLPFIDNWATCDQLSPGAFRKEPEKLLPHIEKWIASGKTYPVRFGVGMLMQHFLDERFRPEYADRVASIRSEEYYVNMMIAWYFATALAKQYDAALPFLTEHRLADGTHNKTIQKSLESYRISNDRKAFLKTLRTGSGRSPR